ncbi:TPA: phage protein NinX family protein [Proteus mirabilis]
MNSYNKYTDLQINELVATRLKKKCLLTEESVLAYMDSGYRTFDPCNNPTDAMPIINEYGISLIYQDRKFQFATNDGNIECSVSNPLKAAMIIFMCIKDAENEKV